MSVRRLSPADAQAMAELHARCFDKPWSALDMSVHAARDMCFGTGEPLASLAVLRTSDMDAEVLTVATDPARRGAGLAGRVLQAARAECERRALRDIFLEVAEDNADARALYKRLGFQPIGRRPGYYVRAGGRMAAVTYGLSLPAGARRA